MDLANDEFEFKSSKEEADDDEAFWFQSTKGAFIFDDPSDVGTIQSDVSDKFLMILLILQQVTCVIPD